MAQAGERITLQDREGIYLLDSSCVAFFLSKTNWAFLMLLLPVDIFLMVVIYQSIFWESLFLLNECHLLFCVAPILTT